MQFYDAKWNEFSEYVTSLNRNLLHDKSVAKVH